MKRFFTILLVCMLPAAAWAQATIDKVVAVVNKQVITQSEWDEQARFEALVNGRPPESVEFTPASLDRLIDQVLMREQIEYVRYERMTEEQVTAQVEALRKQIPAAQSEAQWQALLAKYGLTAEEFRDRVAAQIEVMRFVDMRFRPSVHVESEQVEAYYSKTLVPELMKTGAKQETLPALRDVEPKIRGILAEEKLNEMLRMWLTSLRSQGRIKRMLPDNKGAQPSGN